MRTSGGFTCFGLIFGSLAGVFAHFASYKPKEGVFIVGSADDAAQLFVRPPWTDLFGWGIAGLLVGIAAGVALHLCGFRLVRHGRRVEGQDAST